MFVLQTVLSELIFYGCMQAGVAPSDGQAAMQVPTPGIAVRHQTPFAMTDSSYGQAGTSDISANTQVSDSSWQQRPSIQGMILQVPILMKAEE